MSVDAEERTCLAQGDVLRALVALVFPFVVVTAVVIILTSKGWAISDYPGLIRAGELTWWRQGLGFAALVAWIVRYFPPAILVLIDGPCVISIQGDHVLLPRARRVRRDDIHSVRIHRNLLRKVAHIETRDGQISIPLMFVRAGSDSDLQRLAPGTRAK
ncbi:MAG: hypothetical protein ACXWUX_09870 [Allosphingosinicella sp.]